MPKCIIALAEHSEGTLKKITGEVCSEAVRLAATSGAEVRGITLGPGAAQAAAALGDFGVSKAIAVEGDALATYSGEAFAQALAEAVRSHDPGLVLMGATTLSRDLLGRLGALLDVAPASDVIALTYDGTGGTLSRPVYAGKALLTVSCQRSPILASLRGNVFAATPGQGATAEVETVAAAAAPERCGRLVERREGTGSGTVELSEAEVVVAGGRGLKDPETFQRLIEPLAKLLGAAVGASRAVVDAGWRPHSEQVGQTGKVVAPKLYFACGISGAIQHLAGMRTAGVIVAINKDAEAPIFKVADYGLVGDVAEILPALTEQAEQMLTG